MSSHREFTTLRSQDQLSLQAPVSIVSFEVVNII